MFCFGFLTVEMVADLEKMGNKNKSDYLVNDN